MSQSTQLSTFNFEQSSIRVIAVNNEPWFVAKDLCDTLSILNPSKAILNLDDDEKMISSDPNLKLGSAGNGAQSLALVSESGMYTLILRCRDAVKKGSVPHRFRKWVTSEVLPQIRKTGQYSQNSTQIAPLEPEPKPDLIVTYDQAYWIAKYLVRAKAFAKEVEVFHRKLYEDLGIPRYIKNDIAAKGYDLAHGFSHKLDPFIEQIFPQTQQDKRIVNR